MFCKFLNQFGYDSLLEMSTNISRLIRSCEKLFSEIHYFACGLNNYPLVLYTLTVRLNQNYFKKSAHYNIQHFWVS